MIEEKKVWQKSKKKKETDQNLSVSLDCFTRKRKFCVPGARQETRQTIKCFSNLAN